jgi:Tol biopolymer transport system component
VGSCFRGLLLIGTAVAALLISTAATAAVHDPALRFRRLSTQHFIIYYHQGEDAQAARLARIAEEAWQRVGAVMTLPRGRTHVMLIDETEFASGWATPLPRNTVMVSAAWPSGSEFIGDTDDWLRLVFTHEFTHIVHLDRSNGWARAGRLAFGRLPFVFPNLFLPAWQVEGLATYQESALTGDGRMHAGDFQAIVGEAARARRLQPMDRVNGGLTDWPGGHAPYAYGAQFHAYLADRFGAETFAELADRTASRVPFVGSQAFQSVYGQSLGRLWRDFEDSLAVPTDRPGPEEARQLTHHGFTVVGPRYAPAACSGCLPSIVYSVRNPDGFPTLNRLTLDGSEPVAIATRFLGSTVAVGRRTIVFDQLEVARNAAMLSDLYALGPGSNRVRRLTSGARLLDPDLSPDERTLAAVQHTAGGRSLVVLDAERISLGQSPRPTVVISEPDTQFNAPRWSPDGRLIAAERQRLGGRSDVVVVDPARRTVDVVAAIPGGRVVTPDWRPDGRSIVAAAAPDGEVFNLYEFSVDGSTPPRQLTRTTGGATWPDVSDDGSAIVFVGYTADGFDLFEISYARAVAGAPILPPSAPVRPLVPAPPGGTVDGGGDQSASAPYSPWPTLVPTWWTPVLESDSETLRIGGSTAGNDVLGYHAYSVTASQLFSVGSQTDTVQRATPDLDWEVSYVYDRWQPAFWASASSETSLLVSSGETPLSTFLRRREVEVGTSFPIQRVRHAHLFRASFVRAQVERTSEAGGRAGRGIVAARAGWISNSARQYANSISPERGARLAAAAEFARGVGQAHGRATWIAADARVYLPSFAAHHVAAVRFSAGTSLGDSMIGRTFHLGGSTEGSDIVSFDSDAIRLLRGFPTGTFEGRRVALLNAEYRLPLARPQRGRGTWPLFLHTVHASAFVDAGHVWNERFEPGDLRSSFGGELSFNVVAGFAFPLTVTLGGAFGRDGSGMVRDRKTYYLRLGHVF